MCYNCTLISPLWQPYNMLKNNTISLVMPCKNESRAIEFVLKNLPKGIDEIIVVDNNSKDKTIEVAKRFGAKIIHEPRSTKSGIGYGFALRKGIEKAKGNIIICMDGDGSYPTKEIPSLVNFLIKENVDFISCNRLPFKNPKEMSSIRAIGVKILNFLIYVLFNFKINDSLSGMWVFKRHVYSQTRPIEGGWNFSLEFKLKTILDKSLKFTEKQISYHDRVFNSSKQNIFRTGIEHTFYLFSLKFSLISIQKLNRVKEAMTFQ